MDAEDAWQDIPDSGTKEGTCAMDPKDPREYRMEERSSANIWIEASPLGCLAATRLKVLLGPAGTLGQTRETTSLPIRAVSIMALTAAAFLK